jgi:glycerophosphoryl diester phosphodiesterase
MAAFESAVKRWGVDMLETDAHLTSDGEVVLIHDDTVDRTCDGSGPVASMTCRQLQALDAGFHFRDQDGNTSFRDRAARIPTLDEVLEAFPDTRVNVETKSAEVAGPLLEVIRRHNATHRVLIAAEVEAWRRDARGYSGPWGASRRDIARFWCANQARLVSRMAPEFDVLQVPESWYGLRVVTPRFVEEAHRLNVAVHVWVVDDEHDMRRLLDWGVDGIQTDRPDILSDVLADATGRPKRSTVNEGVS